MTENMKGKLEALDALFTLLYKYELHAFILMVTGAGLCIAGLKTEGFAIITTACTVFKGKMTS